jgi:flagellin
VTRLGNSGLRLAAAPSVASAAAPPAPSPSALLGVSTMSLVAASLAGLGAAINQMAYAADNLTNVSSNATQSRSTIMDTDYALATTQLAKTQIIQQAATAMLAQANQQPQSVMALLKG